MSDPEYWLVPSHRSRTAGRHVKHLPDPDADDDKKPKCARKNLEGVNYKRRRPDDPILADWRLCRYCDDAHDTTPTGGSKDLHNLLADESTTSLDDVREAL